MTYDPNFPTRDREPVEAPSPSRGWTLGIGVVIVLGIIAFLATGRVHNADNAPPPVAGTAANTPAAAPLSPAMPRAPAETTGSAPRDVTPTAPPPAPAR